MHQFNIDIYECIADQCRDPKTLLNLQQATRWLYQPEDSSKPEANMGVKWHKRAVELDCSRYYDLRNSWKWYVHRKVQLMEKT